MRLPQCQKVGGRHQNGSILKSVTLYKLTGRCYWNNAEPFLLYRPWTYSTSDKQNFSNKTIIDRNRNEYEAMRKSNRKYRNVSARNRFWVKINNTLQVHCWSKYSPILFWLCEGAERCVRRARGCGGSVRARECKRRGLAAANSIYWVAPTRNSLLRLAWHGGRAPPAPVGPKKKSALFLGMYVVNEGSMHRVGTRRP